MKIWALLVVLAVSVGVAKGQTKGQTDVAASVYGAFSGSVAGNGVTQSPVNQAGFLVELHHQSNPLVGYELTYSWNRADQRYTANAVTCGLPCGGGPSANTQYVPANAHEVTADWEVGAKVLNLRPFLLAGGGVIFNQAAAQGPVPYSSGTGSGGSYKNSTAGVLVYGGGVDVGLLPHLGLRAQYRGNVYSAPQLSEAYSSTKAFFHTSEPMLGLYVRF